MKTTPFLKTIFGLLLIATTNVSLAADDKGPDSDKLDLKKLEQKYWAAKDDDFSVIQNRAFTKAQRWFLNAGAGVPFNDPYGTGTITQFSTGYFFSERGGIEYNFSSARLSNNAATNAFINEHGTVPNHNLLQSSHTVSYVWVPFYAKMSFLDRSIIYFDMSVGLGAGITNYNQEVSTGARAKSGVHGSLDITQTFFFSEHHAFRFDFKNKFTDEEKVRYQIGATETEDKRSLGNTIVNDASLMFSYTYWH